MSLANSNDRRWDVTESWQFETIAIKDVVDLVYDMDENHVLKLLSEIGNQARWLQGEAVQNAALDKMKLAFAADVCEMFRPYLEKWAEEKAELEAERSGLS